jgi:hypothetical protein
MTSRAKKVAGRTTNGTKDRGRVLRPMQLPLLKTRSRRSLLRELDGRSVWVRRWKAQISRHVSDLGGDENMSEAEVVLVRRAEH